MSLMPSPPTHLPGAPQRPRPQSSRYQLLNPSITAQYYTQYFLPAGGLSYNNQPVSHAPPLMSGVPYQNQNASRKWPSNDQGVSAHKQTEKDDRFNDERLSKQARRGRGGLVGRSGRGDDGNGFATSKYDPSDALMTGVFSGPMSIPAQQTLAERHKAFLSTNGLVVDKANSTIVVENIPEENFSEG
ncbi:hypothetical protein B0H63DRAFT_529781 [Podospora didyma]|uniref:Uncharacterized protein n=1 Tax=Podospora didyma TaxID=330526 RepID=A0AAE0JXX6_9PEZI|nr:hypothetical protein B0H63DRAFT_529781 [Podospora didyma]